MSVGADATPAAGAARIGSLAVAMARWVRDHREGGATDRGERAALRRLNSEALPPAAYWRLAGRFGVTEREDCFWLDLIPMMVDHPHGKLPPGEALAKSGVTGERLERWLRFDAQRARREARRLFVRCDQPFEWAKLARLLWSWDDQDRRGLARDFFLSPEWREARGNAKGTKEDR